MQLSFALPFQMDSDQIPDQASRQGIALSADAKPRLKWTRQLHQLFVDAVSQLGGVDKATPKSVMRIMGIPGLTLYHLKSHLQKYRLARNRESNMLHENRQQDSNPTNNWAVENIITHDQENEAQPQGETMLRRQMEVQRKLQEQIEVQQHLQLRIEAQGKYLQSVLKKAQETLAGYRLNAIAVEAAKAELSELVSAVETECLSYSVSQDGIITQAQHGDGSADSCLTSGDVLETKQRNSFKQEGSSSALNWSRESDEFNPKSMKRMRSSMSYADELCRVKRSCCVVHGEDIAEQHKIGDRIYHQKDDNSSSIQKGLDLNI